MHDIWNETTRTSQLGFCTLHRRKLCFHRRELFAQLLRGHSLQRHAASVHNAFDRSQRHAHYGGPRASVSVLAAICRWEAHLNTEGTGTAIAVLRSWVEWVVKLVNGVHSAEERATLRWE